MYPACIHIDTAIPAENDGTARVQGPHYIAAGCLDGGHQHSRVSARSGHDDARLRRHVVRPTAASVLCRSRAASFLCSTYRLAIDAVARKLNV